MHNKTEEIKTVLFSPNRFERCNQYIKGPISKNWINTAMSLPGHALHVAMELCFLSGVTGSNRVTFNASKLKLCGITRQSVYRALSNLEDSGLIAAERRSGRKAVIDLKNHRPIFNSLSTSPPGRSNTPTLYNVSEIGAAQ